MRMPKPGNTKKAPQQFLDSLQAFEKDLQLGKELCSCRSPDFLISIMSEQGTVQSMDWLLPIVNSDSSTLPVLPISVLCSLFVTNIDIALQSRGGAHHEQDLIRIVSQIDKWLNHPTDPQPTFEIFDFFGTQLTSLNQITRRNAKEALSILFYKKTNSSNVNNNIGGSNNSLDVIEEISIKERISILFNQKDWKNIENLENVTNFWLNNIEFAKYYKNWETFFYEMLLKSIIVEDNAKFIYFYLKFLYSTNYWNSSIEFREQASFAISDIIINRYLLFEQSGDDLIPLMLKCITRVFQDAFDRKIIDSDQDQNRTIRLFLPNGEEVVFYKLLVCSLIKLLTVSFQSFDNETDNSSIMTIFNENNFKNQNFINIISIDQAIELSRSKNDILIKFGLSRLNEKELLIMLSEFGQSLRAESLIIQQLLQFSNVSSIFHSLDSDTKQSILQNLNCYKDLGVIETKSFLLILNVQSLSDSMEIIHNDNQLIDFDEIDFDKSETLVSLDQQNPQLIEEHIHDILTTIFLGKDEVKFKPLFPNSKSLLDLLILQLTPRNPTINQLEDQITVNIAKKIISCLGKLFEEKNFANNINSSPNFVLNITILLKSLQSLCFLSKDFSFCELFLELLNRIQKISILSINNQNEYLFFTQLIDSTHQKLQLLSQNNHHKIDIHSNQIENKEKYRDLSTLSKDLENSNLIQFNQIIEKFTKVNPKYQFLSSSQISNFLNQIINQSQNPFLFEKILSFISLNNASLLFNTLVTEIQNFPPRLTPILFDWIEKLFDSNFIVKNEKFNWIFYKGDQRYHIFPSSILIHTGSWSSLRDISNYLISKKPKEKISQLNESSILDFFSAYLSHPRSWRGYVAVPEQPISSYQQSNLFSFSPRGVCQIMNFIIDEYLQSSSNSSNEIKQLIDKRLPLLLSILHQNPNNVHTLLLFFAHSSGNKMIQKLISKIQLQIYLLFPEEAVDSIPSFLNHSNNINNNNDDDDNLIANLPSPLDKLLHRLIKLLMDPNNNLTAYKILTNIAVQHKTIMLKYLPFFTALLQGRSHIGSQSFRERNYQMLFFYCLEIVDLLRPEVFDCSSLIQFIQCYVDLAFNVNQQNNAMSFIGKFGNFLCHFSLSGFTSRLIPMKNQIQSIVKTYCDFNQFELLLSMIDSHDTSTKFDVESLLQIPYDKESIESARISLSKWYKTIPTDSHSFFTSSLPHSISHFGEENSIQFPPQSLVTFSVSKNIKSNPDLSSDVVILSAPSETELAIRESKNILDELDKASAQLPFILQYFVEDLLLLLRAPNPFLRTSAYTLLLRLLHFSPAKAPLIIPSYLQCFDQPNEGVRMDALKYSSDFYFFAQGNCFFNSFLVII